MMSDVLLVLSRLTMLIGEILLLAPVGQKAFYRRFLCSLLLLLCHLLEAVKQSLQGQV